MEIDIQTLEKNSSKLIKNIDDFSNNISNIYNELNWVSGCWNDYHARLFFTNVESERIKINKTYDELVLLKEVYESIISQYKSIGNKFKVNLEAKEDILNKFNLFSDKINETISLYNDLDLSFCSDIANKINNQKSKLLKIKENIVSAKTKVKDTLEKIEEIEKNINQKLSKIDIEAIKQVDINEFM